MSKEIQNNYDVAEKARAKGLDPVDKVEVPLALTMAEKVIKLIATVYPQLDNKRVINRLLDLEKKYGALEPQISFVIAEEIAKEKYCKFEDELQAMDAGIKVGFSYTTLGVVSSPIEGFTHLKKGDTLDGKKYIKAYFSGPIRSAGTTATCLVLMLIDYIRQVFGYEKYDPTEEEIKRFVTEINDYHDRVTNLQYLPTEDELIFIAKNMPIQIAGDPTESREVSNYKNLARVDTDFIRGGFCLTAAEGLAQKAQKGLRLLKKVQDSGIVVKDWEWLEDYVKLHEKKSIGKIEGESPTYIKDLVAGRPVFGHPTESGSFRFRYGRSRIAGFSAVSIHPATMAVSDDFIATGTQLKIEKPTKGCVTTPCDQIDGPIVKFKDGSVRKMQDYDETKKLYKEIEEIIYFGDLLFPLGDVINRNAMLVKPGYVEEWWNLELESKGHKVEDHFNVNISDAIKYSEKYNIPLHPNYIFYWNQISYEEFLGFIDWLGHARIRFSKLLFPFNNSEKERFKIGKRALELLGVEHGVTTENVVLAEDCTSAILINLGFDKDYGDELQIDFDFKSVKDIINKKDSEEKIKGGDVVLETINKLSNFNIKDKAGEFIGTRMGRPEKAKLRKLTGSPNVLFPVGDEGGRLRSVNKAIEVGKIKGDFPFKYCEKCDKESIFNFCENCGGKTIIKKYCRRCNAEIPGEKCEVHDYGDIFKKTSIDIVHYFKKARERLGLLKTDVPPLIKGVKGTSSKDHDLEMLEKGILRAKNNLCVNKDGTIRYDVTELPLSHFKPKEIEVSVDKLLELGYKKDYLGKDLNNENQILELKPHDILLPCNPYAGDELADEVFINICKFMDELLEKVYGLEAFFNVKTRDDLVGKLCVCMAPHNCAGVISRIIGFTKVQGLVGSAYLHAAMRRDCDGDEAAVMLLLDVLVNFSRKFLPSHRGGTQDAPLVLNGRIYAKEVDDQILDFELVNDYPLELYKKAEQKMHSGDVKIETVKQRIARGEDPYINTGFTHNTSNINMGAICSSYKTLPTMKDKVKSQMLLCEKIRAVDESDVARLIIDRHFMRDLKGNLRKFSQQNFRCGKCNTSYRRPPLDGKCVTCNNPKLIFTISYGGIVKYLEPAIDLVNNYNVSEYIRQDLELTKKYIEGIFGKETEKQELMDKWF